MIPDVDVVVVVELAVGGGVGGGRALGVSMCPANTDIARERLRIVAALVRRKVFIFWCLLEMKKSFIKLDQHKFSCKSTGEKYWRIANSKRVTAISHVAIP